MAAPRGRVILAHGLWMNSATMVPLARHLEAEGWAVRRFGYASCRAGLDENVARLAALLLEERQGGQPVHFLGHSMGGVVGLAAAIAAGPPVSNPMRLVMLGSPYQGSHCAATLGHSTLLAPIFGHTLPEWLARPKPTAPGWLEVGSIAGSLAIGLGKLLVPSLAEPNDGVVAARETDVPGARDAVLLRVSHMGMLLSGPCARQAAAFLDNGCFLYGEGARPT